MDKALAIVILLLLAALGYQWGRAEHEAHRAGVAAGALLAEQAARRDEAAARVIESKRSHRLQEALDAEHLARLDVEASARRAAVADVSLRDELARLAARARAAASDPAAAAEREAAIAAAPVLAEMLGRCNAERAELARYADDSRLAGQTCERAYDALTEEEH